MKVTRTARINGWVVPLLLAIAVTAFGAAPASTAGAAHEVADAVKARYLAALTMLLKRHANVNDPQADGSTALHWAAHWDDVATVERLLQAGADVNAANRFGVTPVFVASTNGNAAVIERLLKAGGAAKPGAGRTQA